MAQENPVLDMMLALHEARFETNKKRLDYEQAQTREKIHAQGAVPSVYASLQASAEKKQKREQAIAKAGQQQQAQAQSPALLPSTVDVTGQTTGRDPMKAFKSATEIARGISGGGQAQQQGPLSQVRPAAGQGTAGTPVGGVFQQSGAPGQPQTGVPPLSPGPQAPQAPPPGAQAVPGQVVPMQEPLNWAERWIGGPAQLLVGAAGRSPGAITAGLHEMTTGMRDTGRFQQEPMIPELGAEVAEHLWGAQQGLTGSAGVMQDSVTRISQKYGPDVARQVMTDSIAKASRIELEKQAELNDPKNRMARQKMQLLDKLETEGSLAPAEEMVLWGRPPVTRLEVGDIKIMMPQTQTELEGEVNQQQGVIDSLNLIDERFYDQYFTEFTTGGRTYNRGRDLFMQYSLDVSPEGQKKLRDFADLQSALGQPALKLAHDLFGAQMSQHELTRWDQAYKAFSGATNAISARASLDTMREIAGLHKFRAKAALVANRVGKDWLELSDTKTLVVQHAAQQMNELVEHGQMDEVQSRLQVFEEIEQQYGLDLSTWPQFKQQQ